MEKALLPVQLQDSSFRFAFISAKTKFPTARGWQNSADTFEKAYEYLNSGDNCGILTGIGDLLVVDIDDKTFFPVAKMLPETFTVRTGGGGVHLYYRCPGFPKKYVLKRGDAHVGEIQWKGQQVVCPGSVHPNRKKYRVEKDIPILDIEPNVIFDTLGEFMERRDSDDTASRHDLQDEFADITVAKIISERLPKLSLEKHSLIIHPVHGASRGSAGNLSLRPVENEWHCFRCGGGGHGGLRLLAVLEGIVDCTEPLRGEKFKKVRDMVKPPSAKKEPPRAFGDIPLETPVAQPAPEVSYKINSLGDLWKMKEKEVPWVLDKMIPERAITSITAGSGQGKSLVALYMAEAIAKGRELWGEYKTKKMNVLYIDQEMDTDVVIGRIKSITDEPVAECVLDYISDQQWCIDDEKQYEWLMRTIKEKEYGVLFLDTFSTIHLGEENSAKEMAEINKLALRLIHETGITVVYLHHHRKLYPGESSLSQSSARGSTELIAKVSSHIVISTKKTSDGEKTKLDMEISQEKARRPDGIGKINVVLEYDKMKKRTTWTHNGEQSESDAFLRAKEAVLEIVKKNPGMDRDSICNIAAKDYRCGQLSVKTAISDMKHSGEILTMKGGGKMGRGELYSFNATKEIDF